MTWDPADYTLEWYRAHARPPLLTASRAIGRALRDHLRPKSAVDVGCAVGGVLLGLGDGVRRVGYEHPDAVELVVRNGLWLPDRVPLLSLDLEDTASDTALEKADVAIATEVAEHLSDRAGDRLVGLLTDSAPLVVWSAAIPGQGGEGHVSERPVTYWMDRFAARGFRVAVASTGILHGAILPRISGAPWYGRVVVYRRSP